MTTVNMNRILFFALMILLLIAVGCKRKKDTSTIVATPVDETAAVVPSPQVNPNDTVLYYERGACFGMCPIFSLVVYADGKGIYHGKNHVNRIGIYQTKVNDAALQKVVNVANMIGYFGMEEVYDNPSVTDLPTIRIAIFADGKLKKVASRYKAPQSLKTLYQELDSLVENQNWEQIKNNQSNK